MFETPSWPGASIFRQWRWCRRRRSNPLVRGSWNRFVRTSNALFGRECLLALSTLVRSTFAQCLYENYYSSNYLHSQRSCCRAWTSPAIAADAAADEALGILGRRLDPSLCVQLTRKSVRTHNRWNSRKLVLCRTHFNCLFTLWTMMVESKLRRLRSINPYYEKNIVIWLTRIRLSCSTIKLVLQLWKKLGFIEIHSLFHNNPEMFVYYIHTGFN